MVWGIVLRAAWHWGGDSSAINNPLGAPGSTPSYLCLPLTRGSAGGDYYFPITRGTLMEKTQNKNLSKAGTLWYRSTCPVVLNRGPASLANHPRELVFPANLGTLSIWQKSRTNGHKMSHKCKFIQINLHHSKAATALLCQKLMKSVCQTTDTQCFKWVTWKLPGSHIATPRKPIGNPIRKT
jgi:hypothetical protein